LKVWDPVVRLCHWALAALVVFDLVYDDGDRTHRLAGYAAVAVVLVRLTWAAIGRRSGGPAGLRPSPARTIEYLRLLRLGRAPRTAGHNPLGLWMVWLLWILVLLLGVTGFMSRLDAFWGDDTVHDAHALFANLLMACVVLHVAGVIAMSLLWKENLPAAMVTGVKRALGDARAGRRA
jgi:cytochrome b